jgi:hypothetical protein
LAIIQKQRPQQAGEKSLAGKKHIELAGRHPFPVANAPEARPHAAQDH